MNGCSRCHGTGWVLTGGSTGPYGDDPLEEAPCPVCAGQEEPDWSEDDSKDLELEAWTALEAQRANARPAPTPERWGRGGIYLPVEGKP